MKRRPLLGLLLLFCGLQLPIVAEANDSDIVVATYNLRMANESDSIKGNGWKQRFPYIGNLIKFHGFDIFGTQEGFKFMLDDLKNLLPDFDYIGVGRDDGVDEGEHSAIFYNTDKFELLDHGDFWLSETPDSVSFGWDAACRRICTWGQFRHKPSNLEFIYFNLHMDHVGTTARAESAKLILDRITELPRKLPVILSGDFNVDQNSEPYRLLNNSGMMKDAFVTADFVYANTGTFNDFKSQYFTTQRIDHIFLSDDFHVKKYGILTDTYHVENDLEGKGSNSANFPAETVLTKSIARVPSDHYPVMLVVETYTKP